MTEKLLKNLLKGAGKVAEVCTVHTILSQQSRHREKKKVETRESPDIDVKRRNNPIQTHAKQPKWLSWQQPAYKNSNHLLYAFSFLFYFFNLPIVEACSIC